MIDQTQPAVTPKVFAAISAVTSDLSKVGIAKDSRNTQQSYNFRGIDQVYNVLAPLLAKHKLIILPQVQERIVTVAKSSADKPLYFVTLKVQYWFISAEDGSQVPVMTYGEGMDSADKATNKALSAAYKYAVIQTFAIPVEGTPDADAETLTEDGRPSSDRQPVTTQVASVEPEKVDLQLTEDQVKALQARIKAAGASEKKILSYFEVKSLADMGASKLKDLDGWLKEKQGANTKAG